MFKRLFAAALIFGAAALAPPAPAQNLTQTQTQTQTQALACMPRDALVGELRGKFGETLAGGGLQSGTRLIEVWRSTESGSFTLILTQPNGVACVLATGAYWHDAPQDPGGLAG